MSSTGVYLHYSRSGDCLYAGVTENIAQRTGCHKASKWWGSVAHIAFIECENIIEAAFKERDAIRNIKPIHNIRHSYLPTDEELQEMHYVFTPHGFLDYARDLLGWNEEELALFFGTTVDHFKIIRMGLAGVPWAAKRYVCELVGVCGYDLDVQIRKWNRYAKTI